MDVQSLIKTKEVQLEINESADTEQKGLYKIIKRFLDIFFSIGALIILSPILLGAAIAIKIQDGGPVIHKRYCMGKNNKEYIMYKFRSMKVGADEMIKNFSEEQKARYMKGEKLTDDERITGVGKFLRATSIDELPQLVSVLKGDMSLVGPRPVIRREAEAYGSKKEKLLSVRSGITGIWQVEGRGEIPFLSEKAMQLQLEYVDKCSFFFDCKIILRTIAQVFRRSGAR